MVLAHPTQGSGGMRGGDQPNLKLFVDYNDDCSDNIVLRRVSVGLCGRK
jgi:hypothetical protein